MIKQRQLFNKGLMLAEVESNFNKLLNTISKQDDEIEKLETQLKISKKNETSLAYALCEELGIIKTKKEFERYMEQRNKDPLDEIFVDKKDTEVAKNAPEKFTNSKEANDYLKNNAKEGETIILDEREVAKNEPNHSPEPMSTKQDKNEDLPQDTSTQIKQELDKDYEK